MDFETFNNVTGIGFTFLLTLGGVLALVMPGRLRPVEARLAGLGRPVEALILISLVGAALSGFGLGHVPVWVDPGGVLAFSVIGALIPLLLSIQFLLWGGAARLLPALAGVAGVAWIAWTTSHPQEGTGIVAQYPTYFLPAIGAAVVGTLLAPRSPRAISLAYATGSLGALVGADLVRLGSVLHETKALAGSVGGAEFFDLVSLSGLWAAALAALPLLATGSRRSPVAGPWEPVAQLAAQGRTQAALMRALDLVTPALDQWALRRGLQGGSRDEIRRRSYAEPVMARAEALLWKGFIPMEEARPVLEGLESLHRHLKKPYVPAPAPLGRRVAAAAFDAGVPVAALLVVFVLLVPLQLTPLENETAEDTQERGLTVRVLVLVWTGMAVHVFYPFLAEWITGGTTIGKAVLGLRVRRLDGGRPTGWDFLARNVGRLLDLPMGYAVAFAAPPEEGRQRLGDYFAGTAVVDERAHQSRAPVTTSPTPMAVATRPGMRATNFLPR